MADTVADAIVGEVNGWRSDLELRIVSFLQKEIQDKTTVLTRDARRDEVAIDSIDVVNVIFAIEEDYDVEINLTPDVKFETVGEIVDTLISFIPEEKRARR